MHLPLILSFALLALPRALCAQNATGVEPPPADVPIAFHAPVDHRLFVSSRSASRTVHTWAPAPLEPDIPPHRTGWDVVEIGPYLMWGGLAGAAAGLAVGVATAGPNLGEAIAEPVFFTFTGFAGGMVVGGIIYFVRK
ncbi:MAG: hypothetical protein KY467_10100 [Gemmatimonadetes bacterium]|nr:hypothetical protein [Gemmatimonadota bacterium]